jgi:hypothetical protein
MKIKVNIPVKIHHLSRLEYVLDFINNHPFSKSRMEFTLSNQDYDKEINYGVDEPKGLPGFKFNNILFSDHAVSRIRELKICPFKYGNHIYYGLNVNGIENSELIDGGCIQLDVFETIFFHLSRIEETLLNQADYIGKKELFEDQLLVIKYGIEKTPVVDDLIRLLIEILTNEEVNVNTKLAITHDIDTLKKFNHPFSIFRKIAGHFRHRKSPKGLIKLFKGYWKYLMGNDPFDTFSWMLVKNKNIHKQIYFLSGGNHYWDTPYDFRQPLFNQIVKQALNSGYILGIHPSYDSWKDKEIIQKEKDRLEKYVTREIRISRQHFLNFDINITPYLLLDCNIDQDSSLGFTRKFGFRCGTGFPYFLYDFKKEEKINLLEDPLVFMDSSCLYEVDFDPKAFSLLMHSFFEKNKLNTRINCNFHNSFFDEAEMRGIPLRTLYEDLIKQFLLLEDIEE